MLRGKELVLAAINRECVDPFPWVPFCGVHCASLLGKSAADYLRSSDLMLAGLRQAISDYHPDGLPVIFDLQLEAEVLGCQLHWAVDNPPSVCSHPLQNHLSGLSDLVLPQSSAGRFPVLLPVIRELRRLYPDLALYGLCTGPLTLALHLLGSDIFLQMYDDPAYVEELLRFTGSCACRVSSWYLECGCDLIAVVDPMTSQIAPEQFQQFCSPILRSTFDYIRQQGAKSALFVCGHAQKNLPLMCASGCDHISVDENIPLAYLRELCQARQLSFGGNLPLTTGLLLGDEQTNMINTIKCLQQVAGDPGFILAPGCDLPYATPPKNLQVVAQVLRDPEKRRIAQQMAQNPPLETIPKIDLSAYIEADKIKVAVLTLDSRGCAPCQYMLAAAEAAAAAFPGQVEVQEYSIKTQEGIQMMASLGVSNIPSVCIDREVRFVSEIPDQPTFVEALRQKLSQKRQAGQSGVRL